LRLAAMLGGIIRDDRIVALVQAIDAPLGKARLATRPEPSPVASIRPRVISVTDVDRLKADPFAFYAKTMLRLSALDAVDAEPTAAWRGSMVHDIFDKWFRDDALDPEKLSARVAALFADPGMHPVTRAMWQPRLVEAIEWIAEQVEADRFAGRDVLKSEVKGSIEVAGVTLKGIADRIDRSERGLAIVDYKTGAPPSNKAVETGFSMQLGLLGLIAERGGFAGVSGTPIAFEYWSLRKNKMDGFGIRTTPIKASGTSLTTDNFVGTAAHRVAEVAGLWLTGNEPFTAKLHPEYAPYGDFDHLMRLQEWYGRES